jgi:hypothetical protein
LISLPSFDFCLLVISSVGVLVSFLIYLYKGKIQNWRAYSTIANLLGSFAVTLSMEYGENPRSLVAVACWSALMFAVVSNTSQAAENPASVKTASSRETGIIL